MFAGVCVAACSATPHGPTVQVMPPPGKPFYQFTDDDVACKHYAEAQVQGEAEHANWMQAAVAGGGTILGAGLGAAIGGGHGAAIGAGAGALGGAVVGAVPSGKAQDGIQSRYDMAYGQCMYAHGNQVPGMRQQHAWGRS